MTDKRHWFVREASSKKKKQPLKFSRKQWTFLERNAGVNASLDALFGREKRSVIRFTEIDRRTKLC